MVICKTTREIKSKKGELHFRRFTILGTKWFSINIHRIYKADEDKHLHNHPWNFTSILLAGGYYERTPDKLRLKLSGAINRYDRNKYHKIDTIYVGPVTTLCFMGPRTKEADDWGYLVDGEFVHHKEYRKRKRENSL